MAYELTYHQTLDAYERVAAFVRENADRLGNGHLYLGSFESGKRAGRFFEVPLLGATTAIRQDPDTLIRMKAETGATLNTRRSAKPDESLASISFEIYWTDVADVPECYRNGRRLASHSRSAGPPSLVVSLGMLAVAAATLVVLNSA